MKDKNILDFISKANDIKKMAEVLQTFFDENYWGREDLKKIVAVLVSEGINKNDDVFLRNELERSFLTVVNKPINIEHDNNNIVGHIYNSFISSSNDAIKPIDVVAEGFLYYRNLIDKINPILLDIELGNKFVSMEAWFHGYDYLYGNQIIQRNEDTSFLDDYLIANGGPGYFNGQKVARVLRDIVFGGMAIVANPANEKSIILSVANVKNKNCVLDSKDIINLDTEAKMINKEESSKVAKDVQNDNNKEHVLCNKCGALNKKVEELESSLVEKDKTLEEVKASLDKALKEAEENKALAEQLSGKISILKKEIVTERLEARKKDLDKFEIAEEDYDWVLSSVKDLSVDEYKSWLTRANRLFKVKSHKEEAKETEVNKEELKSVANEVIKDAKSQSNEIFNADLDSVKEVVSGILSKILKEEDKQC